MTESADRGFLKALAEAECGAAAAPGDCPRSRRPDPPACIGFSSANGAGAALWDFATEWTDEPTHPIARPASSTTFVSDSMASDLASIAEELGLGGTLTPQQLASRRRDFLWRNHPDRQPAHARARADERVALANALYDTAQRRRGESG